MGHPRYYDEFIFFTLSSTPIFKRIVVLCAGQEGASKEADRGGRLAAGRGGTAGELDGLDATTENTRALYCYPRWALFRRLVGDIWLTG